MSENDFMNNITRDLAINELELSEAMVKQPSLYAYYAQVYANKMLEAANAKTQLGVLEKQIYDELKKEEEAGKKLTDKDKEKRLKGDARYFSAKSKLDNAESVEELMRNLLEALRQKRDMLVQLSLRQREELKSNISVSENGINLSDRGQQILQTIKSSVDNPKI